MSIPFFLDASQVPYTYREDAALTDVETGGVGIITTLRLLLVTTLGWSEPSTALFKTPVDAAGRFLDILLTRISATVIEWRVRNHSGTTICTRRAQIVSGNNVRYFCNTQGVLVECLTANPNSSECLQAHILDESPDAQSSQANCEVGGGRRSSASADDGNGDDPFDLFAIDNGSAGTAKRGGDWGCANNNVPVGLMSASLSLLYVDPHIYISQGANKEWTGRICHCLVTDSRGGVGGTEHRVNLDDSTTVTFKTVGLIANPTFFHLMAFRKS